MKHEIETMTDIKLDETDGSHGESMAVELTVNRWLDWTARAAVVVVFTALVVIGVAGIPRLLPLDSIHKLLMVAARIANVLFLSLVAATTITRLVPIQKSKGIEPRISALLGTFLMHNTCFASEGRAGSCLVGRVHDVDPSGHFAFFRGAPLVGQIFQHFCGGKALGDRRTLSNRPASVVPLRGSCFGRCHTTGAFAACRAHRHCGCDGSMSAYDQRRSDSEGGFS